MYFDLARELQYGPTAYQRQYQGQPSVELSRQNMQLAASEIINQHRKPAPPPPYSPIDPLQNQTFAYNAKSSNVHQLPKQVQQVPPKPVQQVPPKPVQQVPSKPVQQVPAKPAQPVAQKPIQPVPISKTIPPSQMYCVACHRHNHEAINCPSAAHFSNNPFPAGVPFKAPPPIPTLPKKENPYKWTADQAQQASQPLEVKTKFANNPRPSPQQTPSPNYDASHNPYVWKNPQPSPTGVPNRRIIDLNLELPRINQEIKENQLPNFQHFNKELSKNKSLTVVRKSMVDNKYLSDVKFIVGGSVVYGHKMFLITASFLFFEHFHVKGETEMMVAGIDHDTFIKVITYCYTNEMKVTEDDVLQMVLAADKLQVRQITNICHGFISKMMSPDSIFIIFEKALELDNELFQKKCIEFINKNEAECFSSKGFLGISLPSLLKILEACNYPREKSGEIIDKWNIGSHDMSPVQSPSTNVNQPDAKIKISGGNIKAPGGKAKSSGTPGANAKPTGAVKKQPNQKKQKQAQNQQQQAQNQQMRNQIPSLMSLPFLPPTGPPMMSPFPYPPPHIGPQSFPYMFEAIRPFANNTVQPLICLDDDDDDRESIISKDDDNISKVKIGVLGKRYQCATEFSRLDFMCKRSLLIHEVWFSEDMAKKCKEVKFTISVFENDKRNDIHNRVITNNKPGKLLSVLKSFSQLN